jgi:HK97 family phage prohead protease
MKTIVRSVWTPVIKNLDLEGRIVRFIGTKESEDRTGDVIEAEGWQLDNFVKNPVFLWNHDPSLGPIGRVKQIIREGTSLLFDVEFAPPEVSDLADRMFKLIKSGFLKAVSVGFIPKEFDFIRNSMDDITGIRFTKTELLELSAVSIPAHQDALLASSEGKSFMEAVTKAEKTVKLHEVDKDCKVVTLEEFTKTALDEKNAKANDEDDEMTKEEGEKLIKAVATLEETVAGLTTLKETVDLSKSAMTTLNTLLAEKLGKSAENEEVKDAAASDEGDKPTPAVVPAEFTKALAALLGKVNEGSANFKPQGDK